MTATQGITPTESAAPARAREQAESSGGAPSPAVCGLLRWAAATADARHAVEIGSGAGVTGLWLLEGMPPRGVLTTVEPDAERHGLATDAYDQAGVHRRVRVILGEPDEVLDRLSDRGYELAVLNTRPTQGLIAEALRLLHPGGLLVLIGLGDDPDELAAHLEDHERLASTVLPLDDGVALAILLPEPGAPDVASDESQ